jgi:hypothetical protein
VDPAAIGKGRNSLHSARREEIPGEKKKKSDKKII